MKQVFIRDIYGNEQFICEISDVLCEEIMKLVIKEQKKNEL